MYCGNSYTTVSTKDNPGDTQYFHALYMLGYGPLKVKDIYLNQLELATNIADVRNGSITVDGDGTTNLFSDNDCQLEIQQSNEVSLYPQKVVEEQLQIQLLNVEGKTNNIPRISAENPQKIQIEISMGGLFHYDSSGNRENATVKVGAEISFDMGKTWSAFAAFSDNDGYDSSTGISTFTKNNLNQMRFVAERTLTYSEIINVATRTVELRVTRQTVQATDGKSNDTVYLSGIRTWCFNYTASKSAGSLVSQIPVIESKRKNTVRLAISIKATTSLTGNIDALNCIEESCARTWNRTTKTWSTDETATNNPASLVLKAFQLPCLGLNKYPDSKINLDRLGELYEFCEDNSLVCNGVTSSQKKLQEIIRTILSTCKSALILDGNQYSFIIDKPRTVPVTILNNHSILSEGCSNSKTFDVLPDGYRISFINEDNGYQQDELKVMYDTSKVDDPDAVLTSVTIPWVTNRDQIWKLGRYMLAKLKLRPETWVRKLSIDGNIIGVGDLVELQDDTILVGIGDGGEIKSLIMNDTSTAIKGIVIDGKIPVTDATKTYGVKIMQADGINSPAPRTEPVTISESGWYNTFYFTNEISLDESIKPCIGDICSFGEYSKITTQALCFGKKKNSDGTFDVTLIPYADGVYTADSGTIPEFDSKTTSIKSLAGVPEDIPQTYATIKDVNEVNKNTMNWLGTLDAAPSSPSKNDAYYNSTDKCSYIYDGTAWKILCSDGKKGDTGPAGTTYWMDVSAAAIKKSSEGIMTPSTIVVKGKQQSGSGSIEAYPCRFKIWVNGNTDPSYTSSENESSVIFPLTKDMSSIIVSMYKADGFTDEYDYMVIPVLTDGYAYTIILTDSHQVYDADSSGKVQARSITTNVVAWRGTDEIDVTIGILPTVPGFNLTKIGTEITITALEGTSMQDTGVIEIPVTVNIIDSCIPYGRETIVYGRNGIVYGRYHLSDAAQTFKVYFSYQKSTFTSKSIAENNPVYKGTVGNDTSFPTDAKYGDWILFTGTGYAAYSFGFCYYYTGVNWVIDNNAVHNKGALDDMLSILDSMSDEDAPAIKFVKRLVATTFFANQVIANEAVITKLSSNDAFINKITSSDAFITKLTANDAFINKITSSDAFIENLATKIITLKNTGCIQTENYSTTDDTGFKLNAADGSANFNDLNVYGSMTFYSKINELYGKSKLQLPNGRPTIAAGEQSKGLIWIE